MQKESEPANVESPASKTDKSKPFAYIYLIKWDGNRNRSIAQKRKVPYDLRLPEHHEVQSLENAILKGDLHLGTDAQDAFVTVEFTDASGKRKKVKATLDEQTLLSIGPNGLQNFSEFDSTPVQYWGDNLLGRTTKPIEVTRPDGSYETKDWTIRISAQKEKRPNDFLKGSSYLKKQTEHNLYCLDIDVMGVSDLDIIARRRIKIPNMRKGIRYNEEQLNHVYRSINLAVNEILNDNFAPQEPEYRQALEDQILRVFGEHIFKMPSMINPTSFYEWRNQRREKLLDKRSYDHEKRIKRHKAQERRKREFYSTVTGVFAAFAISVLALGGNCISNSTKKEGTTHSTYNHLQPKIHESPKHPKYSALPATVPDHETLHLGAEEFPTLKLVQDKDKQPIESLHHKVVLDMYKPRSTTSQDCVLIDDKVNLEQYIKYK